jgi:hypothetical protein
MRTWTAISPSTMKLPHDLALLLAPVRIVDPARPEADYVGRAEGVLLDEAGGVVGFFVRLSPTLVPGSPRTLVPASVMAIAPDAALLLAWPRDKLLAQPRLDEDLQRYEPSAGPGPGEGRVDVKETVKETAEGSAIGAVVGGILGGLAGGPVMGLALAAFFGAGGGFLGFIAGGAQETRDEPSGMRPDNLGPEPESSAFLRLEERLRDPDLSVSGLVHLTRFSPMSASVAPLEQRPPIARAS